MSLGKNVTKRRCAMKMTQRELGIRAGATDSFINQIEKGVKMPSLLLGVSIASELGCTVEDLLKESD
jgi:DNA-binding XRE family transcriptional regulator